MPYIRHYYNFFHAYTVVQAPKILFFYLTEKETLYVLNHTTINVVHFYTKLFLYISTTSKFNNERNFVALCIYMACERFEYSSGYIFIRINLYCTRIECVRKKNFITTLNSHLIFPGRIFTATSNNSDNTQFSCSHEFNESECYVY